MKNGALGGKLVGAGGGGSLMFYAEDRTVYVMQCLRRNWKKCASASISKEQRLLIGDSYPIVILAGGLATRLRPVTEKIPKALVNVGGKPFIDHQLRLMRSYGFRNVIISAWYRGEMIQEYVGDGERFGLKVDYVFDGDQPLGTAGAVRKVLEFLNDPFFVIYGDSYLPCDYPAVQAHFTKHDFPAIMTIFEQR